MSGRGQHRVRYFGWLHPAARRRRVIVEFVLGVPNVSCNRLTPSDWPRNTRQSLQAGGEGFRLALSDDKNDGDDRIEGSGKRKMGQEGN